MLTFRDKLIFRDTLLGHISKEMLSLHSPPFSARALTPL